MEMRSQTGSTLLPKIDRLQGEQRNSCTPKSTDLLKNADRHRPEPTFHSPRGQQLYNQNTPLTTNLTTNFHSLTQIVLKILATKQRTRLPNLQKAALTHPVQQQQQQEQEPLAT